MNWTPMIVSALVLVTGLGAVAGMALSVSRKLIAIDDESVHKAVKRGRAKRASFVQGRVERWEAISRYRRLSALTALAAVTVLAVYAVMICLITLPQYPAIAVLLVLVALLWFIGRWLLRWASRPMTSTDEVTSAAQEDR